jgi:Ca2+-binding RTX toxin-like protein
MYDTFQQSVTDKQSEISSTAIHVTLYAHDFIGYGSLGADAFSLHAVGTTSIMGRAGDDDIRITGTSIDYLDGGNGNDYLSAGDSNDILVGGLGADSMIGGLGDDTYYVDDAGDKVIEALNEGTDEVVSTISWELGANVEKLRLADHAAISGTGNALDNTIQGNDADNVLDGGAGADSLVGYGGNDTYWVDNTGDVVIEAANEGTDRLIASVSYVLAAGQSIERLDASLNVMVAGVMDLTGNEIAQKLVGNNSENRLDGGGGADTMIGNYGDDTYVVDSAGDLVIEGPDGGTDSLLAKVSYALAAGQSIEAMKAVGGVAAIDLVGNELAQTIQGNAGSNKLQGAAGADFIQGLGGQDRLEGGNGADTLEGGNGADTLDGGAGKDQLWGGGGADILTGGAAADRFVFKALSDSTVAARGRDTITDFKHGVDTIDLQSMDANSKVDGDQAFLFIGAQDFHHKAGELHLVQSAGNTVVEGDVNGDGKADFAITLTGHINLSSSDFAL